MMPTANWTSSKLPPTEPECDWGPKAVLKKTRQGVTIIDRKQTAVKLGMSAIRLDRLLTGRAVPTLLEGIDIGFQVFGQTPMWFYTWWRDRRDEYLKDKRK